MVDRHSNKWEQSPPSWFQQEWEDSCRRKIAASLKALGRALCLHEQSLSAYQPQSFTFYFDVSRPYRPASKQSNRAFTVTGTNEVRAKPDG